MASPAPRPGGRDLGGRGLGRRGKKPDAAVTRKTGPADEAGLGFWQVALYIVVALTILRLAFLRVSPLEFDPAEAARWLWSRGLAWGYGAWGQGTASPLPIWLTAASSSFCGPGEACARAVSPLLQAATAMLLGGAGVALGSWRLGAWSMLVYATLPGVALGSMWLGADAPLMFFWAAGLYALLRLRRGGGIGWALLCGLAAGLGALSSEAMLLFPFAVTLYLAFSQEGRRSITGTTLSVIAALMVLALLPNLLWRFEHGAPLAAAAANATLQPSRVGEFLAWQFVIFGPIPLYFLLRQAIRGRGAPPADGGSGLLSGDDRLLLLCLSLPVLLVFLLLSPLGHASPIAFAPGAEATAYVAAALLAAGMALEGRAFAWLKGSVVAQGLIGLAFYGLVWITPHWHAAPRALAQAVAQFTGWHALGQALATQQARELPPPKLLIDGQVPASLLLYYAEIPPDGYVLWDAGREGPGGEAPRLRLGDPGPFFHVGTLEKENEISQRFTEVHRLSSIIIPVFTGELRRFYLDRLNGFKGYQP
jgi:4-amino-4-deoxy-L-arabinose transferase-like glycosyltransferase